MNTLVEFACPRVAYSAFYALSALQNPSHEHPAAPNPAALTTVHSLPGQGDAERKGTYVTWSVSVGRSEYTQRQPGSIRSHTQRPLGPPRPHTAPKPPACLNLPPQT